MCPEGKATGFVNAQESSEGPSLDHWRCWEHKVLNQGELWNTIRLLTHPAADTVPLQKPLTLTYRLQTYFTLWTLNLTCITLKQSQGTDLFTSSNTSRTAAPHGSSSGSIPPPGTIHWSGCRLLLTSRTCQRKRKTLGNADRVIIFTLNPNKPKELKHAGAYRVSVAYIATWGHEPWPLGLKTS